MKSNTVSRTVKLANMDLMIRVAVIWKLDENPLKQLSQNVPNRMLVCTATAITMRRLTKANIESLRKGEYMKVNPSMSVRLLVISVLYDVPLLDEDTLKSVLLAKMPMKSTAMA